MMVLYSSRLVFPNTKDAFTEVLDRQDSQLNLLTKNAYMEMDRLFTSGRRPKVMTALAIEERIYLSSSIVGKKVGNLIVDTNTWKWRENIPDG